MTRISYYNNRIDDLTREIALLRNRSRFFVGGEIVSFLAMIGFVVLYTVLADSTWTLALSALSLAAYIVIRRMDFQTSEKMQQLED